MVLEEEAMEKEEQVPVKVAGGKEEQAPAKVAGAGEDILPPLDLERILSF